MAFDYAGTRDRAHDLIKRFGRSATLRKIAEGAYSTGDGTLAVTTSDQSVQIVLSDFSSFDVSNGLVQRDDRRILLSAKGLTAAPDVGDRIIVGSDTFTIVRADPAQPGATAVLYDIQARR